MNLANKLTLFRVALVPFFVLFMYLDVTHNFLIAFGIFVIASITDALDGHIARKNNLITDFGKFLDPLADKILVMSALAIFVESPLVNMSAIPFIIIVSREFMVSGLRLIAADSGVVVPAGIWGKLKTAFTMVTIIVILLWLSITNDFPLNISNSVLDIADIITSVFIWASTVLTVISGLVYLKAYLPLINTSK